MLLNEADLTAASLADVVGGLIADRSRLDALSSAAFAEGARHRGDTLIRLIDEVAAGSSSEAGAR